MFVVPLYMHTKFTEELAKARNYNKERHTTLTKLQACLLQLESRKLDEVQPLFHIFIFFILMLYLLLLLLMMLFLAKISPVQLHPQRSFHLLSLDGYTLPDFLALFLFSKTSIRLQ